MKHKLFSAGKMLTRLSVATGLIASSAAFALDSLPSVPGDSGSVGKTTSAKLLAPGGVRAGLVVDGADIVKLDNRHTAASVYGSGHQGYVGVSFGLLRNLELGLSIKATSEFMMMKVRDGLYENSSHYESGFRKFKETGYAGSRMMIKYRLIQNGGLNIAVAPFAEEGMGERGMYSVTRLQKAAYGWLALLSYGQAGIGEVNFNGGLRYQEPQRFDDRWVRNEVLGRLNVTGYLSDEFGLFATVGARRLMVADATKLGPDSKPVYGEEDSSEVLGGLVATIDLTTISVYRGGALKGSEFGSAKYSYGLSLATKLGNKLRDHQWDEQAKLKSKSSTGKVKNSQEDATNPYPEMSGIVEPAAVNGGPLDDFDRIREKMKRDHQTAKSTMSEQEQVEAELEKLRAADAKVEQQKQRRALLAKKQEQVAVRKEAQRTKKQREELRRKASAELDEEYGITVEDTSWKGLD